MYGIRTDRARPAELRAAVTPRVKADKPIGQWNRYEITHRKGTVSVVLNGQTVLPGAMIPDLPPKARIGSPAPRRNERRPVGTARPRCCSFGTCSSAS